MPEADKNRNKGLRERAREVVNASEGRRQGACERQITRGDTETQKDKWKENIWRGVQHRFGYRPWSGQSKQLRKPDLLFSSTVSSNDDSLHQRYECRESVAECVVDEWTCGRVSVCEPVEERWEGKILDTQPQEKEPSVLSFAFFSFLVFCFFW